MVSLGLIAAFVLKLPVIAVYFVISLDEFVKIPAVYLNYKKYRWVKDLTVSEGAQPVPTAAAGTDKTPAGIRTAGESSLRGVWCQRVL